MFYEDKVDDALRLGDIVQGFILGASHLKEPSPSPVDHHVSITYPRFSAVLTPCCSVGERCISLAPLIQVRVGFFDNPYIAQDLTRINLPMTAVQAVPPAVWAKLPAEEKQKRLDEERRESYAFVEFFVYAPDALLPEYTRKRSDRELTIAHYMIDFRQMQRVECEAIVNTRDVPIQAKVLQLSVKARAALRDKLAAYFHRIPREDEL